MYDNENEYRTGCFGVKHEESSIVVEENKVAYASVRKLSPPCFSIRPQVFDDDYSFVNFELPKRDIKSTTDHPKKSQAAMPDESMSLKFEIENFLN